MPPDLYIESDAQAVGEYLAKSKGRGRRRDDEIFTSAAAYAGRAGAFRLSRGGSQLVG